MSASDHKPMTNQEIVAYTVKKAGGMNVLAKALGIRYQAIQAWTKIPAERIVAVEKVTGIPREKLRPDLYRR